MSCVAAITRYCVFAMMLDRCPTVSLLLLLVGGDHIYIYNRIMQHLMMIGTTRYIRA